VSSSVIRRFAHVEAPDEAQETKRKDQDFVMTIITDMNVDLVSSWSCACGLLLTTVFSTGPSPLAVRCPVPATQILGCGYASGAAGAPAAPEAPGDLWRKADGVRT